MNVSSHLIQRASQRGISALSIEATMLYGEKIYRQGLIFHVINKQLLPDTLGHREASALLNLVVVQDNETKIVLTCYRNHSAMRRIKKKPKYLLRLNKDNAENYDIFTAA